MGVNSEDDSEAQSASLPHSLKDVPCLTSRLRKDSVLHTLRKPRDPLVAVVQNERWTSRCFRLLMT